MDEVSAKNYLMANNEEFKALAREHQEYEQKLEEFVGKSYLNPDEQMRETIIKKKKLALKDQMQLLIERHQQTTH